MICSSIFMNSPLSEHELLIYISRSVHQELFFREKKKRRKEESRTKIQNNENRNEKDQILL